MVLDPLSRFYPVRPPLKADQVADLIRRLEDGWRGAGLTLDQMAGVLATLFPDRCGLADGPAGAPPRVRKPLSERQVEALGERLGLRALSLGLTGAQYARVLHLLFPDAYPGDADLSAADGRLLRSARLAVARAGGVRAPGPVYDPSHYAPERVCQGPCGRLLPVERFGRLRCGPGGRARRCLICEVRRVQEYDERVVTETGRRRRTRS